MKGFLQKAVSAGLVGVLTVGCATPKAPQLKVYGCDNLEPKHNNYHPQDHVQSLDLSVNEIVHIADSVCDEIPEGAQIKLDSFGGRVIVTNHIVNGVSKKVIVVYDHGVSFQIITVGNTLDQDANSIYTLAQAYLANDSDFGLGDRQYLQFNDQTQLNTADLNLSFAPNKIDGITATVTGSGVTAMDLPED